MLTEEKLAIALFGWSRSGIPLQKEIDALKEQILALQTSNELHRLAMTSINFFWAKAMRLNIILPFSILAILAMLIIAWSVWGIAGVVTFAALMILLR